MEMMFLTMAVGILALLLGMLLNSKIPFLRRVCIPAPVTGGIVISLLTLLLHALFGLDIAFDGTLKDVCMLLFFTSVGYQSDISVLKSGGKPLLIMVCLVAVLIAMQDFIGVGIARLLDVNPLLGMAAGSITMCGGHGTAAGFSGLLEEMGLEGAPAIAMSAATFGLLAGSLLGGPLAERIISRRNLSAENADTLHTDRSATIEQTSHKELRFNALVKATYELFLAIGLGMLLSNLLSRTGITFPTYFGALIVAAVVRNVSEAIPSCPKPAMGAISCIGDISLSLFLGMAMIMLRLWELADLALPLLAIAVSQVVMIALFARFAAFPLLGKDYDAAVLVSGLCGFGLGATPNAMANMSAVCSKYRYAPMPFIVVPVVGAMFVDIINVTIITLFLNLL